MPIYEYLCQPNKHRFEVRQNMSEPPLEICPECGGPVRRVILPVGIVFKGSGFYATDSRSATTPDQNSGTPGTDGKIASESSAGSKEGTSKDASPAKPDAKPAGKPTDKSDTSSK